MVSLCVAIGEKRMSHLATVNSELRDSAAIKAAAKALGLVVVENARARFFFGTSELLDLVIPLPGRYDLGLKRTNNGSYELIADEELIGGRSGTDGFGRGDAGRKLLGEDCRRLKVEYAFAVLQAQARKRGQSIRRENLENGKVRVTISGGR